MSNTVGGRSARLKAADSGWAASISSRVSGRAAGLYPPATLASLSGSVNSTGPAGDPEKDFWVGCCRAGEERPDPEKVSLKTVGLSILPDAVLGRFIYPPDFRVVQAKPAFSIFIGC